VPTAARAIQTLILFSAVLGVFFLLQAYPLLPPGVFYAVTFGWSLFVVDSALTFLRPRISYYMGFVLAAVTLAVTLGQPAHYALVEGGDVLPAITLILGSAAQVLLIGLVLYYIVKERRTDPWAWPGGESQD